MSKTSTTQALPAIKFQAGKDLFRKKFGGKRLSTALRELIKNCRDYDGRNIQINIGADYLEVIDDGIGMDESRRNAFCSAAISTSDQDKQSGKFGTGSKMMLYLANGVEVMTKTHSDSGVIYFKLDTEKYQSQVLGGAEITPTVLPANQWAEEHSTGTKLRYDFSGKASSHLKKLDRIAEELSQELPMVVLDAISFNGKSLPAKQLKGKPIREEFHDDKLGWISLEVYTLKGGTKANNGIFLSSTGMPEVSFARFYNLLPVQLRLVIPDLYLNMADMSGVITCRNLFGPFINEDRESFQENIADADLTKYFIHLLHKKEEEIRTMLGLQKHQGDKNIEQVIQDLFERSEKAYGKVLGSGEDHEKSPTDSFETKPMRIHGAKLQYEPGQKVELSVVIDYDKCDVNPKDLQWLTASSGLKEIKISSDNLRLTGIAEKTFGWRSLSVTAGPLSAQTHYEIVVGLRPYLSANTMSITVGREYKLTVHNTDLIESKISWRMTGNGKVQVLGRDRKQGQAVFFATEAGQAMVYAEGYKIDGKIFQDTCEFQIREPLVELLRIKDFKFRVKPTDRPGNPPVTMIKTMCSDYYETEHELVINTASKIWHQKDAKNSAALIMWIIGQEFSRFFYQDIHQEQPTNNVDTQRKYSLLTEEVMMALMGE